MTFERLIKRIVWTAKCECGMDGALDDTRVDNPPRERQCKCGKWVSYTEMSAVGPDLQA